MKIPPAVQELIEGAPGETEALHVALTHVLSTVVADERDPADLTYHDVGDILDLLDAGGWYLTSLPAETSHPASEAVRLEVARLLANQDQPLAVADAVARWIATGELPKDGDE